MLLFTKNYDNVHFHDSVELPDTELGPSLQGVKSPMKFVCLEGGVCSLKTYS